MRHACRVVSLCCSVLLAGAAQQALAQIAPRLTGEAVIARLDTAKQDLAARASQAHDDRLAAVSTQLGGMADALRKTLGDKASQPADIMDDSRRAAVFRGDAAVQRTRAYLDQAPSCPGNDAKALTDALATTIDKLAKTSSSSKATPVINSVETIADHRPVFALHAGNTPIALALVGSSLSDPQCADPQLTATDEQGKLLDTQPVITGVLPTRVELKFPEGAGSKPGTVMLHVVPKHKVFLRGCTAQPEAVTALQVTSPMRVSISYNLITTCSNGQRVPSSGTLPDITAYGATSSRQVEAACPDPSRYAISAKMTFGDGSSASAGPIEQAAAADITMGLPAGFTLSWGPSTRTVFVRSAANVCKGVY